MSTWKRGRLFRHGHCSRRTRFPSTCCIRDVQRREPYRVPGTAVFMTSDPDGAPPVLLHHLKHNKVLHEKVIIMSVTTEDIPQVSDRERTEFRELGEGFYQVVAKYGFMESPDVPAVLRSLAMKGDAMDLGGLTVEDGGNHLLPGPGDAARPPGRSKLATWRKKLFIVMARNAQGATSFFGLPPNRVVEMGAQIQL